ncbi:hypothetical protein KCU89_g11819, partial [Aureobasidium melanogenum]
QAPPGTRSLEDLGTWRCKECHALNGQESEAKAMIREIAGKSTVTEGGKEMQEVQGAEKMSEDPEFEDGQDQEEDDDDDVVSAPATSTRSKVRQRKK